MNVVSFELTKKVLHTPESHSLRKVDCTQKNILTKIRNNFFILKMYYYFLMMNKKVILFSQKRMMMNTMFLIQSI